MPSLRDYIDPGGKMLACRLDQFCSTLESLGTRLRGTIATAIGETLGGFVRDVAWRVLEEVTQGRPGSEPIRSPWSRPVPDTLARETFDPDERGYWADEEEARSEPDPEEQPTRPAPERLPTALSAGLQAASWWLQRWSGQGRALTTVAVGLIATAVAFLGGPLVVAVLGLAASATQFTSLPDAIGGGTSVFSGFDSA
jgi:hypothetical protein